MNPTRFQYIDALRGWAILLVIFVHASQGFATIQALKLPPSSVTGPFFTLPAWLIQVIGLADLPLPDEDRQGEFVFEPQGQSGLGDTGDDTGSR